MKIKACVFDLDGTLLDTLSDIRYYLNIMLKKYSLPEIDNEKTARFVGNGAHNLVRRAVADSGMDIETEEGRALCDNLCREYVALYDSNPNYLTAPYVGITESISELRRGGMRLAVLSNKPDPTVKQLVKLHFGDAFEIVQGAKEGTPLKPDPTALFEISRELGVMPSEIAYFGDTATDIETGLAFGAGKTVGVSWGFRTRLQLLSAGADEIIDSAYDIGKVVF